MTAKRSLKSRSLRNSTCISTSDYERAIMEAASDISKRGVSKAYIVHYKESYLKWSKQTEMSTPEWDMLIMNAMTADISEKGVSLKYIKKYLADKGLSYKAAAKHALRNLLDSGRIVKMYDMYVVQGVQKASSGDTFYSNKCGTYIVEKEYGLYVLRGKEPVVPESRDQKKKNPKVRGKSRKRCRNDTGNSTEDDEISGDDTEKVFISKEQVSTDQNSNTPEVRRSLKGRFAEADEKFIEEYVRNFENHLTIE